MRRRVVVTGLGVLSPMGCSVKESWANIITGKSGITKLNGVEFESLPCRVAALVHKNGARFNLSEHFSKSELKSFSPASAYALLATKEAIQDSRLLELGDTFKMRTGVAVGMGMVDLQDICSTNDCLKKAYHQVSPFFVPRILPNMAAGQISIKYGFRGPNHAVATACASGTHAIGDSFRFIQHDDADVMVCGAAEACICPLAIAAFCRLRALSTSYNDQPEKASRPFDTNRDGFVMGEGSAILVLEELEHALKRNARIYAEILGYGLSGDASHLTAPRADGTGALFTMQTAVKNAKLNLDDVGYINAHATSTPVGDAIEALAIKNLFGSHITNLAVSSTKGAHGHLLGSAGSLESVFTIKAIDEGILPPILNLDTSEEKEINFVRQTSKKWGGNKRRIALKNSFGFGGTNACLCIAQYVE